MSGRDRRAGGQSARTHREEALPRFSLGRPTTVLVMLATILVVGTVATVGIPLELIPRGYDEPSLLVRVLWNDAPSQEVLEKAVLPLEEELSTVPGLANIYSYATTGFGRAFMTFKLGTDMNVAYREVRDRVERAKSRMPEDVDRVLIRKQDETSVPVWAMGITIDPGITDYYNLIQNEVVMPIQRIDGVASVDVQGLEEKEILIELDRERVASAGLNIYQLSQELAGDNFTMASGNVLAGGKKLLLRSVARYADVEALENRMVGPSVRLRDVARVRFDEPEKNYRARANSKPALFLVAYKEGEANAIAVSKQIAAAVDRMGTNPRLGLVKTTVFFDQGRTILESLGTLLDSGRIGGVFAVLVLFLFLRRFRMTLIITLSIPLSVFLGITAMYFAGETLNILSLLGLMISVGLLVDNSVVVAENIYRWHAGGAGRREACVRGAGEISLAIVMATLTTVVVFLPVSLVQGQGQFFMLRLAIPITVSLVASLLVALIFVPLAVYLTLPGRGAGAGRLASFGAPLRRLLSRFYERTLGATNRAYTRLLGFFLGRRMDLILALLAVLGLSAAIAFQEVKLVQIQEDEGRGIEIDVRLPQSTTLEEAEAYFLEAEKILEKRKEELDLDGYFVFVQNAYGEIQGWFNNPRTKDITPREVTEAILAELPERAGAKIYTGMESEGEEEERDTQIFVLRGEDSTQLEALAEDLEKVFAGVDGVLGVKRSDDLPAAELGVVVDRERARRLEINPQAVAGVVRASLGGQSLPKFYRDGREIPVRVRYQEEDRETLGQLFDFQVPTGGGEVVSLASVTRAEHLEASKRIYRRNKQVSRSIVLELVEGEEEEAREKLRAMAAAMDLPEGVSFGGAPRSSQNDETAAMLFAMYVSVLFIYLLMGFLFESFILPLSIVTTIPLAILGVYWAHFLFGYDLDPLGLVGIVLLIGVVVNNGIVLVDTINRLRRGGMARAEAVLASADRRFRPIMMTALTTICGMVPLTLSGTNSIGLSYTSFGITLIGGMTSSTLLTLLVVPVAYTLFDDLRLHVAGILRRGAGGGAKAAGEVLS